MQPVEPYILLLSATIDPGEFRSLLIDSEVDKRLDEYKRSLEYWLNYQDTALQGIVFCENSAADLSSLQSLVDAYAGQKRPVEWLSFNGNSRPPGMHYGYAELGLIDYALKNSELLQQHPRFIKVTGRLLVKNLAQINRRVSDSVLFAADSHRFPRSQNELKFRLRTQILIANTPFYREYLLNARDKMTPQCSFIEEYLMRVLWPMRNQPEILLRLPLEPQIIGTSASAGHRYGRGISKLKSLSRAVLRRVAPSLWL